ncbi:HEAT repeat-containing protein 1 [Araneus ventricosus]|uniref:HEAT repeat-containing protein 1 n=1 Tax=Araneus ventricosus TaxID=182803 RepID=A0A4Y2RRU6_ARAVE|nr:HEAT repeat-containing protein 1 [Araneus ventricosus]
MAGETALARQLKKLAVPQSSLLIQDKLRKSFLFDHREAATVGRDEIFAYGTNGLEKLKLTNPMFAKFENNLFHVTYKEMERSVQTANVNKKLDEKITEFLRMLSPFVTFRAAHEALEWLIYRFHIHLYNADELVACALPHYYSSTFVRIVQLLDLNDPSCRWAWLLPVQKSGVPLEKSAILNRISGDGGFKKFLCDLAPNSLKVFKSCTSLANPVISFSTLSIYEALCKGESITDSMVVFMFPYILKGLKSGHHDYMCSSYLIISAIVMRGKLEDIVLFELLTRVFENYRPELAKEAFELLVLIFQQQSIKKMPLPFFKLLVSIEDCTNHLVYMSELYDTASLIRVIIRKSVPYTLGLELRKLSTRKCKQATAFCKALMNSLQLNEKNAFMFVKLILKCYLQLYVNKKCSEKSLINTAKMLLANLERKYSGYFDKAIESYFQNDWKKEELNQKLKRKVRNLINESVNSLKNKVVNDIQTTLVLGVNHANNHIRKSSIKYMLEHAVLGQVSDASFIESSLFDRLSDDCPNVVLEVLASPQILLHFVDKQKLLTAFEQILKRKFIGKSDWYQVQMKCLDILCEFYLDESYLAFEIFSALLPFIFPLRERTTKGFHRIMSSKLKTFLPILQMLHVPDFKSDKEPVSEQVLLKMNFSFLSSIKKYIAHLDSSSKSLFLTFLMEKSKAEINNSVAVIFTLAAGHALISKEKWEQKLVWIKHLLMFFESLTSRKILDEDFFESIDEETLCEKYVEALQEGKFPSLAVYNTFYRIIVEVRLDFSLTSDLWLSKENHTRFTSFKILTLTYEHCVKQIANPKLSVKSFKLLLTIFLQTRFETVQHLFCFLSNLWANSCDTIPTNLQIAALKSAVESCKDSNNFDWFFDNSQVFISLLRAVASPDAEVCETGLELLSSLLQQTRKSNGAFKPLAEHVYEHWEEISVDNNQCYFFVNKWLSPAAEIYGLQNSISTSELESQHSALQEFIKVLSDDNSPNSVKCTILSCLHGTESVGLLSAYIPLLNKYLSLFVEKKIPDNQQCIRVLELLLQKFSPVTAVCLKDDCVETETFFKCLQLIEQDDTESKFVQSLMLKCLTKEFFTAIPSIAVQKKLLDTLLDSYLNSTSDVGVKLKKVLGKLSTFAYWIIKELQDKEISQKQTTLKDFKKSKLKEDNSNFFESKAWKKITVLLEIIQSKSKLDKRELLIPELFNLLNKTLSFDSQSSVEYVKQLILSTIHNCCQNLGSSGLDERQFKVELIVQCIRSSTNPKTHHQSLLLLNLAATLFPEYVLSNVMSIFTFMGSSLVRQDDSYSFQVISQTIETIVPSLLAASSFQKEKDAMQIVASVIRVFVDSLSDIPQHRQLPLFHKLIITLEPSQYLWIPLAQICDQHATVFRSMLSSDESEWKNAPTLEFAINLLKLFTPSVQIDTCINLLNFLSMLPDRKEQSESEQSVTRNFTEPFNVSAHSNQQLQMYKCNVLSCINIWLSSQVFVSQVSELDTKALFSLEEKYQELLEKALNYLQHQRSVKNLDTDESKNTYNLFPLLFDLVGHINALLPCSLFIRVVRRLLQNPEMPIQKRAIELLNSKLEQQQYIFTEENHKPLLKLLNPLLKVLRKKETDSVGENSALNQQTALYALHLLTKVIGAEYPTKFHKVLNVTIQILKDNENEALTVNALLCLAQLCSSLNIEVLSQLNTFMPIVIGFLSDYKTLALNDCLILGIVTALLSIVENLGMFLSCYMQSIVTGVCLLCSKYLQLNKKVLHEKLLTFQTVLAKDVDLRILLTAVDDSYSSIKASDHNAIISLMTILEEKLSNCSYTDAETYSSQIEQFCLKLLDFRNSSDLNEPISSIESSIISVLKTFVMKLPVSNFYTFFQKLYHWATATEPKLKLRLFTFYNLTCHLSKSLKSLFLIPAKSFLKRAASDLDSNNVSKTKSIDFADSGMLCQYLNNILDTLNTCFLHDDNKLVDKDNFDFLLQPLVDQLENLSDDGENSYQERISNYLCSCIARFMAAVSDNTLWKKLNYQILLKTRHDSPIVRFATIQVIREVVTVMGDNYLVLLPESIPFLAAIMEDDSSEVEQECNTVITEMEKILGEPIRKYF